MGIDGDCPWSFIQLSRHLSTPERLVRCLGCQPLLLREYTCVSVSTCVSEEETSMQTWAEAGRSYYSRFGTEQTKTTSSQTHLNPICKGPVLEERTAGSLAHLPRSLKCFLCNNMTQCQPLNFLFSIKQTPVKWKFHHCCLLLVLSGLHF